MTDATRGEVTNAIWLCRNCHKIIDNDSEKYSPDLLFAWRESHEESVAFNLGNKSDALRNKLDSEELSAFSDYPAIIRRIVIDKPDGWEWRLTAELLRHLNRPIFRQLEDLRKGYYTKPLERVADHDVIEWITLRIAEMEELVGPMSTLLERMNTSWGAPGEPGSIEEIHHTCCLIRDHLKRIAEHEERTRFVKVSDDFEKLVYLLRDCIGSQADKFASIPEKLDRVVAMIDELRANDNSDDDEPTIIHETITIELPSGWEREMAREIKRAERQLVSGSTAESTPASGLMSFVIWFFVIAVLLFFIF